MKGTKATANYSHKTTTMKGTKTRAKPPTTMSLKLLIDAPGKRVVFAEAGKDFVDFLFYIMSLPVANVIGLLGEDAAALGSVANLHGSTKNLKSHFLPTAATILKPAANLAFLSPPPEKKKFPRCTKARKVCRVLLKDIDKRAADGSGGRVGGFVEDLATYMVTDDLSVMPLSTASTIDVIKKLNVTRVAALEERVVKFTINEADKFLKASLESKSVLTDFFLKDKCRNSDGPPQTVKREFTISVEDDNNTPGNLIFNYGGIYHIFYLGLN